MGRQGEAGQDARDGEGREGDQPTLSTERSAFSNSRPALPLPALQGALTRLSQVPLFSSCIILWDPREPGSFPRGTRPMPVTRKAVPAATCSSSLGIGEWTGKGGERFVPAGPTGRKRSWSLVVEAKKKQVAEKWLTVEGTEWGVRE